MIKSGLTILSGSAATSLLLLMRNLGVAFLIPVEDYGIAATFAIAMAVVEMATDLGLQQQIVQSDKGAEPRFQAALQGFQVLRGVIAGLVLFVLAGPLASFMGVGDIAWAYQILAIVPVMNALQHFDMHRMKREMVFGPFVLARSVPALLSLLVIWPLAIWFGDFRVMFWAIMLQITATLILSHVVAKRPYQLVFDAAVMREGILFGWPLLVNGILLFVIFQGDKIIVGRVLGMEALAVIAMGYMLTQTPMQVLSVALQNFFLPQLSRRDADFQRLTQVSREAALFVSVILLVAVSLLGPVLTTLVFGDKYTALEPLLFWLAVMQATRLASSAHAVVSLSVGFTRLMMWASLIRVCLLPLVWWVAVQGGDLRTLIWIGIVGEIAGFVVGHLLLRRRMGVTMAGRTLVVMGALVVSSVLVTLIWPNPGQMIVLILGLLACPFTFTHLRAHLRTS